MKKIRQSIFETNSSSTHALVYNFDNQQDNQKNIDSLKKHFMSSDGCIIANANGEYGWEYEIYSDAGSKLDYLATLYRSSLDYCDDSSQEKLEEQMRGFLDIPCIKNLSRILKAEIKINVRENEYAYVDHADEKMKFFDFLNTLSDEDLVQWFLLSSSYILTTNDNDGYDELPSVNCIWGGN